jgi:hypothetical protein
MKQLCPKHMHFVWRKQLYQGRVCAQVDLSITVGQPSIAVDQQTTSLLIRTKWSPPTKGRFTIHQLSVGTPIGGWWSNCATIHYSTTINNYPSERALIVGTSFDRRNELWSTIDSHSKQQQAVDRLDTITVSTANSNLDTITVSTANSNTATSCRSSFDLRSIATAYSNKLLIDVDRRSIKPSVDWVVDRSSCRSISCRSIEIELFSCRLRLLMEDVDRGYGLAID